MAQISHADFIRMQQERQSESQFVSQGPRVGYFSLKDNGDEAIVRFNISSVNDIEIYTVHSVTIDGKYRKVNCLRTFKEPIDKCPLCASGKAYQQRIYIKLLEYVRKEDGTIDVVPKVWERPTSYLQTLANLEAEYGTLSNSIFKIKRNGAKGSLQTTYAVMYCNPQIYNQETYVSDFSAFTNYNIIGGPVLNKTFEDLLGMSEGSSSPQQVVPDARMQNTNNAYRNWNSGSVPSYGNEQKLASDPLPFDQNTVHVVSQQPAVTPQYGTAQKRVVY